MSLLEPRDYYKPFKYAWAYQAYKIMQSLHWLPHESPMAEDIKDWNSKLTPSEKELLTQLFRFFTQADVDVARGYFEKYGPKFPHPEVRMMLASFMSAEANHIDAYATLIDTLGLPEIEYKAFLDYQAMREKHEYMFERSLGNSISDLALDIAIFSAFGEGMQLFSSFAILMSFQRRSLMKGMTTIVEWSIRDESHHVESMIRLFRELVAEHPRIWNDTLKKRIYDACRDMVRLEDAFIDQAFSIGSVSKDLAEGTPISRTNRKRLKTADRTIEGITPEETKQYIRYIADRRLLQLGLKPEYGVKKNPFAWLDWIMNAPTHTNFFENRSTEYSKGETPGWDNAFDFLHRAPVIDFSKASVVKGSPTEWKPKAVNLDFDFRIYAKPGCPYCDKAKALLTDQGRVFDYIVLEQAEARQAMFQILDEEWGTPGWKTSPMIFKMKDGEEVEFIGGYSELSTYLA